MDPALEQNQRATSPLKPPRKRKRIVISCTECHRRKQKCDRAFPCSNCVARNKHSLCHYENESARKAQLLEESNANFSSEDGGVYRTIKPAASDNEVRVGAFGYAKSDGNNNTTLGIFKKIENHEAGTSSLISSPKSGTAGTNGLREKYKTYIRQLPSKQHIEKLLAIYFKESNHQYYPLDEGIFRDHLMGWHSLSFSTLNKGPTELPSDMQFFPALLFQTLALALQFLPPDYDPSLDSLKYAAGMTFDDLASDYSESGCQILSLLGKRHTTLTTVQAGFLRTAYLKNCGMVPESWHYLSQTIRDAQEIGLHRDNSGQRSRKKGENPGDVLENQWLGELRRRLWLILSLWDIHMAIVLGRPVTVDLRDGKPAFPIDAPIPKNRREQAPLPRTESDPPTPLTMLLWTAELCAPLVDIYNLEKDDPHQNNSAKVEKMHRLINAISLHCPPCLRAQNPDTTFDSLEECHWIPRARAYFQSTSAFTVMVLHRPYIFTSSSSRTKALKAGLVILRSQRTYFNLLNAKHYKMFALVLNTFDAIVLVAAIFILHPFENRDDLDDALQHYEWGMERFDTMSDRNSMAKSALGVLKAIHVRLKRALSLPTKKTSQYLPPSTSAHTSLSPDDEPRTDAYSTPTPNPQFPTPPAQNLFSNVFANSYTTNLANPQSSANTQYTLPTISNLTEVTESNPSWEAFPGCMSTPQNFDFSSMAPLQPMHDLAYNNLGGMSVNGGMDMSDGNGMEIPLMDGQWQFEGDFGNDSFWGFMNNYNP